MAKHYKNYIMPFALTVLAFQACGGDEGGDGGGDTQLTGAELYMQPHPDGNTFACASCHALEEPTGDGFIRPGHPIGDAFGRPDYKNGLLTDLRDAVNVCRVEWMVADAWDANDPDWLALQGFLEEQSPETSPPLETGIVVQPPADLTGGDPVEGQELFNGRCIVCLLYTSPSPRDATLSRMPSSA